MKKGLQIPHLRPSNTVSDGSATPPPGKTGRGRLRHCVPELRILDRGGPFRGGGALLQGSRRGRLGSRLGGLGTGLRKRPRHERERRASWEPRGDLARPARQLESPDRVAGVDNEGAVALEARGPRVPRDLVPDG